MALQTAELERVKEQIRGLGRRDWLWWSLGLLSLLLVGGGLMHLFLRRAPDAAARPVELTLGQAVAYLYAVAVVAFQIYSLLRNKESRKMQVELLLETLKNEVGRLESLRDPHDAGVQPQLLGRATGDGDQALRALYQALCGRLDGH